MSLSIDKDFSAQDCVDVGCFLASGGRREKGEAFFREAIRIDPKNATAMANIASILAAEGKLAEGRAMAFESLIADQSQPLSWHVLGKIATEKGDFEEARMFYRTAIRNNPNIADFWLSMSQNAQYRQAWDESLEHYRKSLSIRPDDANVLMSVGMIHMLQGDFDKGLPLYENRLKMKSYDPFPVDLPKWDGNCDLRDKKVLVCAEQGIGDCFQLARYGAYLKEHVPGDVHLSLICHDNLREIMECWPGYDAFFSPRDVKVPEHDFQIAMMSLPWLCCKGNFPEWAAPVVKPSIAMWDRKDLPSEMNRRIGVCWRGNPKHVNDKYRSMRLEDIDGLCQYSTEMHNFYAFQHDITPDELSRMNRDLVLPTQNGWIETAQALMEMDLVVCVDTAVAHLAATLGIRTWLLLPATNDFRWGLGSETTRWYPTMRIFRQEKLGEWGPLIEKVTKELETALDEAPVYGEA